MTSKLFSTTVKLFFIFSAVFTIPSLAQDIQQIFPLVLEVEVRNPLPEKREAVMVLLEEEMLLRQAPSFNSDAFVVSAGETEIPSQYIREAGRKGIALVLDKLGPDEQRSLNIRYKTTGEVKRNYPKRTQAELSHKVGGHFKDRKYIGGAFKNVDSLRVPDEHTDHSYYIRYEGPGWESDKVGYRYYLDWRNGIDVFGKTTSDMVLQQVGLDGFDSYHEMQPWGMDILKVGDALGVGSIAHFHDGHAKRIDKTDSVIAVVRENGPVYSSINTNYYGWKVADHVLDVNSLLGIHAGSRLTHHQLDIEGEPENMATGLTKSLQAPLYKSEGGEKSFGYLATYGPQSLNKDNVGLAILFRPKDFISFTEDAHSHVVKLRPSEGSLDYYFLAAWELEKEGIKNEKDFLAYLDKTARELANPVDVSVVKK